MVEVVIEDSAVTGGHKLSCKERQGGNEGVLWYWRDSFENRKRECIALSLQWSPLDVEPFFFATVVKQAESSKYVTSSLVQG